MAQAFNKNKKIRRITTKTKEVILSQYADHTTFILDGSTESFEESSRLLDLFGKAYGLRLNCSKTSFMDRL